MLQLVECMQGTIDEECHEVLRVLLESRAAVGLLLHATTPSGAERITKQGFDDRMAATNCPYEPGSYFTTDLCKRPPVALLHCKKD